MKKQITRISVFQSAKVMAVLYLVISLPFVLLMAIPALMSPLDKGPSLTMLVVMPFLYLVFGFLISAFGAWAYNAVAASIGGIEFTVSEPR